MLKLLGVALLPVMWWSSLRGGVGMGGVGAGVSPRGAGGEEESEVVLLSEESESEVEGVEVSEDDVSACTGGRGIGK